MSGFFTLRHLTVAAVLASAVSGAAFAQATTMPSTSPTVAGPAMPAPGTMPAQSDEIATINGQKINSKAFYDILMQVAGMRVFQEVLDLTLAQKACIDAGVPLDGEAFAKRLDTEREKWMDSLNIKAAEGKPALTKDQRLEALSRIIQQQGMSGVEFRLALETRAELRALSEGKIEVTDAEITDAYDGEYGEKRVIHIISYPEGTSVLAIKTALNTKKADGSYPTAEEVAVQLKLPQQPSQGTISKSAKTEKVIHDTVFELLKAPHDSQDAEVPVSATEKRKVLFVLDEIIKDKRTATPLATVKEELRQRVFDAKQGQWMGDRLNDLRRRAQVEVKDTYLQDYYRQIFEQMQRQQAAATAASQPVTAPASMPVSMPATRPAAPAPKAP